MTPDDEPGAAAGRLVELVAEADTGVSDLESSLNLGGAREVFVNERSMLVRFNADALADAIPPRDELTSATLVLTSTVCAFFPTTYLAHRMTTTWHEGTGGGVVSASDITGATALCAQDADIRDGDDVCVPGAEWDIYGLGPSGWSPPDRSPPYVESPAAPAVCVPVGPGRGSLSFDVTADVRAFLAGAENHGWAVHGPHGHTSDTRAIVLTREFCGPVVPGAAPCREGPRLILRTTARPVVVPPEPTVPPLDRSVTTGAFDANRFLIDGVPGGTPPLQVGVADLDPVRASVIRGLVRRRDDGAALGGVQVRVLHADHLGVTATRESGQFDMLVEGGTDLVLVYEHPGYLPVQRVVHVPANDYVWAPDVALIPRIDPTLTGPAS